MSSSTTRTVDRQPDTRVPSARELELEQELAELRERQGA